MTDDKLIEIALWAAEPYLNKEEDLRLKELVRGLMRVLAHLGGPIEDNRELETLASHALPNEAPEHI